MEKQPIHFENEQMSSGIYKKLDKFFESKFGTNKSHGMAYDVKLKRLFPMNQNIEIHTIEDDQKKIINITRDSATNFILDIDNLNYKIEFGKEISKKISREIKDSKVGRIHDPHIFYPQWSEIMEAKEMKNYVKLVDSLIQKNDTRYKASFKIGI